MLEDYASLQPANAPFRVTVSFYMQVSRAHVQCPRRARDRHIRLGSIRYEGRETPGCGSNGDDHPGDVAFCSFR